MHLAIFLLLPSLALGQSKTATCDYRCIKDGSCEIKIDKIYGGRDLKFPFGSAYTWGSCASDHMGGGCTFVPPECDKCNEAPIRTTLGCLQPGKVCNSDWACTEANQIADLSHLKPYHYDIDSTGTGFRVSNCTCENLSGTMCDLSPNRTPWPNPAPNVHPLTGECDGLRNPTCHSTGGTPVNRRQNSQCLGGISPADVAALLTAALPKSRDLNTVDNTCPDAGYCVRTIFGRQKCCKLIGLGNRRFGCPTSC